MNNNKLLSHALLILCGLSAVDTFAQTVVSTDAQDIDTATAAAFDYNPSWYILGGMNMMRPDSGFGVGDHGEGAELTFGVPLAESWELQLNTRYGRQNGNGLKYQQNMLGADILYMFSRSTVRPFIGFGAGEQEDRLDSAMVGQSGYSPYINGVLGLQVKLSDQWGLQVDFRREHGYLKSNYFNNLSSNSNNYLSVGVSYAFGPTPSRPIAKVVAYVPPPPAEVTPPVVMAVVPAAPPVRHSEKIILSSTELFGFDQYKLQLPQVKLDQIADALNQNQQIDQIVISGYTDRIGNDKYNQKLSERRAGAVKDYLISKNVAPGRLSAVGKGKADPMVVCNDKKRSDLINCLEPNRRVEVEQFSFLQSER